MLVPYICLPLFGIGLTEGILIIVSILVLFGSTRLPKLGKGIGQGIRNFKNGLKGDTENSSDSDKNAKIRHSDNDTP